MNLKLGLPNVVQTMGAYLLLTLVCIVTLWVAWTGFVASDDEYYVAAALGWMEQFPYVAQHFGTVRASIAIPLAFGIYFFGESPFTISLSTMFFLAATAFITTLMLSDLVGKTLAFTTSVLLITTPLFALKSTTPCADLPELFYVISSFWLFWKACWSEKRIALLIFSGLLAGMGFSAHELTSALLVFYGLLFLISFRLPRFTYLWILLGFTAVILSECAYYWATIGNPFHRFELLLNGVAVSHDRAAVGFLQIASGGTLHVWDPIDPIVMIMTHHNFSLIGWLSVPAVYWLIWDRRNDNSKPIVLARLLLGLAVTWLIFNTVMLRNIIVLPRYYMVTAYCLLLVIVIWTGATLWMKRRTLVLAGFSFIVLINFIFVSVDNKNPKYAEKNLVNHLSLTQEEIYTDPLTADDARWYCRWKNVDCGRIKVGVPKANDLFYWNPKNTSKPNRLISKNEINKYQPKPSWTRTKTFSEEPRKIVILFGMLGIRDVVPENVWRKLEFPNPEPQLFVVD